MPPAAVPAQRTPIDEDDEADTADEALPSHALPQRLLLGDIPSARRGVVSVGPGTPLSQTTFLMRTKGHSQIPVTTGMAQLHGIVTWGSVAKMYEAGKAATLDNAIRT